MTHMAIKHHQKSPITKEEFAAFMLPDLIRELRNEYNYRSADAHILANSMVQRLNKRFQTNKMRPIQVFKQAMLNIVVLEINKFGRLMDKNFGFTPTTFNKMVADLKAGNEVVFERADGLFSGVASVHPSWG